MSNYLDDNLNQSAFLDINYLEVLRENTFKYCLYTLLTHTLDLEEFNAGYKNKNVGRKAYPPILLLRVIFYTYYRGMTSSRVIERSCRTDLKFMALAAGRTPHFTTIAVEWRAQRALKNIKSIVKKSERISEKTTQSGCGPPSRYLLISPATKALIIGFLVKFEIKHPEVMLKIKYFWL